MGASLIVRWHLDLAAAALVAGGVGALLALRRGWSPTSVATLGAMAVLVPLDTATWWLALALLAATVAREVTGPAAVVAVDLLALGVVIATGPGDGRARAVLGIVGIVVVVAGRRLPGRLDPRAAPALVAAGTAAVWLGAPDTDVPVVVGGAMVGPLLVAGRARPPALGPVPWVVPGLALVWAAGQGWAGRPAGLPALLVVVVAVTGWSLVDRGRTHPVVGPVATALAMAAAWVPAAVAARTVGLRSGPVDPLDPGVALALLALLPWCALARWSAPGSTGT